MPRPIRPGSQAFVLRNIPVQLMAGPLGPQYFHKPYLLAPASRDGASNTDAGQARGQGRDGALRRRRTR